MNAKFLLAAVLLFTSQAYATLGGSIDSVETDRKALEATKSELPSPSGNYKVFEITLDSIHVREYVTDEGVVFGLAWNGFRRPDLTKLLGSYLAAYQTASTETAAVPGRRVRTIKTPHLVVDQWGHMRNLQGRAYDPSLLPTGVKFDDIK